jgi:hypothetical protein
MMPINVVKNTSEHSVKTTIRIQRPGEASPHLLEGCTVGQQSMVFQGDPSYTTYLVHSHPLGWDKGNPVTGRARPSP